MNDVSFWTRVSIAVLIVVPAVVFVWFLRDAVGLLRGLREREETDSDQGPGTGGT